MKKSKRELHKDRAARGLTCEHPQGCQRGYHCYFVVDGHRRKVCLAHYNRLNKGKGWGSVAIRPQRRVDGKYASYSGAHGGLSRRHNGPASNFLCYSCGDSAEDWAFRHDLCDNPATDLVLLSAGRAGNIFCPDKNDGHWAPLCRGCHRLFDIGQLSLEGEWRGS